MKIKNSFAAIFLALAAVSFSSCINDGEDYFIRYSDLIEDMKGDSSLTLANVVKTGIYYNASEVPVTPSMDRSGDTLNVYVQVNATAITDSVTVKYYTQDNKLFVTAAPYFNPYMSYAQSLCIITRKLQFVGKVDNEYELFTRF